MADRAQGRVIISDSAEGYRHKGYAITMAEKLNRNAELVVDDSSADSPDYSSPTSRSVDNGDRHTNRPRSVRAHDARIL
jgi:hypothetical protein